MHRHAYQGETRKSRMNRSIASAGSEHKEKTTTRQHRHSTQKAMFNSEDLTRGNNHKPRASPIGLNFDMRKTPPQRPSADLRQKHLAVRAPEPAGFQQLIRPLDAQPAGRGLQAKGPLVRAHPRRAMLAQIPPVPMLRPLVLHDKAVVERRTTVAEEAAESFEPVDIV